MSTDRLLELLSPYRTYEATNPEEARAVIIGRQDGPRFSLSDFIAA